jgi:glycosyltransferase involved in cell wall biosynthesis
MKKNILILGPYSSYPGGIVTVIENLKNSKISEMCNLFIRNTGKTTSQDRSFIQGLFAQIKIIILLVNLIIIKKIDIVHIHTCSGFTYWRDCIYIFLGKVLRCKIVCHIHGGGFGHFASQMNYFKRVIFKFTLESSDSLIVLTDYWKQSLSYYAPNASWKIVENGVPLPKKNLFFNKKPTIFLFIGDLSQQKGVRDLIKAAAAAAIDGFDGIICIAGHEASPGQLESLHELTKEEGIQHQIKFLGVVLGEEKKKLLSGATCLVLPSYVEGLPMVLLEAMSYGIPVISTMVGGIPELVKHNREGFLIEPGNINSLAKYLLLIQNDPLLAQKLGVEARKKIENSYSIDVIAGKVLKIYSDL